MTALSDPRYDILRANLRAARRAAGLTQADVADALGVKQQVVSNVEAGDRRVDALELADFARLYGCEIASLLGDAGARRSRTGRHRPARG